MDLVFANFGIVVSITTVAEVQSTTSDKISNAISEINIIAGDASEGLLLESYTAIQDFSARVLMACNEL